MFLDGAEHEECADERWNTGDEEEILISETAEEKYREEHATDRSQIVHRPDVAEIPPPVLVGRNIGDNGITRRAAHFSGTIQYPEGDDEVPRRGERIADAGYTGEYVPDPHEYLPLAGFIGDISRYRLRNGNNGIAEPVDKAQDLHVGAHHGCQKNRPQRKNNVRSEIIEK